MVGPLRGKTKSRHLSEIVSGPQSGWKAFSFLSGVDHKGFVSRYLVGQGPTNTGVNLVITMCLHRKYTLQLIGFYLTANFDN
jgi:hypothetical protein